MDVIFLIRSIYLLSSAAIIAIYTIPALKKPLLAYGPRSQKDEEVASPGVLDSIANLTVPHAWFSHFYFLSLASSIFWAFEILTQGSAFNSITHHTDRTRDDWTTPLQIIIAMICLSIQGLRRLVECWNMPTSTSRMFVGHWLIGLAFYAITNVAVWIEVNPLLMWYQLSTQGDGFWKLLPAIPTFTTSKFALIIMGIALFLTGSIMQSVVHSYLRELRSKGSYAIPTHPLFKYTLTPHYFAECLEYTGLALIDAPTGQLFSTNMLCCLVFVVVNLGVTADGTRQWYRNKFGAKQIEDKSRMIPFVW